MMNGLGNGLSGSDLAFVLCGLSFTLGMLLVWAIAAIDRSPLMVRIRNSAYRRLR